MISSVCFTGRTPSPLVAPGGGRLGLEADKIDISPREGDTYVSRERNRRMSMSNLHLGIDEQCPHLSVVSFPHVPWALVRGTKNQPESKILTPMMSAGMASICESMEELEHVICAQYV